MNDFALLGELRCLDAANNHGYGLLPIPDPKDEKISNLIYEWMTLDEKQQEASANSIKDDQRFTLLAYSERQASLAVRKQDREMLFLGLIALGLDGWRADWRDNALLLSLHYHSAILIRTNPNELFRDAGTKLSKKVKLAFDSFMRRNAEDKSIEAMGYAEGLDEGGFRYKRTW